MRLPRGGLGGLVLFALAGVSGCSTEGSAPLVETPDPVDRLVDALGEEMQDCSRASVTGSTPAYNATSKTLTITFPANARSFVLQAPNGQLTVNGYACRTTAGLWLTTSNVLAMVVKGSSGDDVFVLDELPGSLKSFGTKGGISIDGNGGTDSLSLRGTTGADSYTVASTSATTHYADLNNDKNAEVKFTHSGNASLAVSTGKANDTFNAAITSKDLTKFGGGGLAGTVQSLQIPLDAYGGDGDDTLTGGAKDDRLFGDNGNDTFKSAAVDGADQYDGGPGTDHLDYTGRTAGVTVDLGLSTPYARGTVDVASLTYPWSGTFDITPYIRTAAQTSATLTISNAADPADLAVKITAATGSPVDAHLRHDGQLVLALKSGGVVDGFTVGGTDAGSLGFADGTTVAARIKVPGGTSYNAPNDGDRTANSGAGEGDDVQDTVETLTGGGGNDTLVGNNLKNTISGGKGDDVLASLANNYGSPSAANGDAFNGGDGDDLFDTGYTRNLFAVYTGNADFDTVTYRKRINVVTVNLSLMTASPGDGESGESGIIADSVEKVVGGSNSDALTGSVRPETLVGGPGSDVILAGAGDDTLLPGDEDSAYGGDDATDTLDGQGGNDKVFYANYGSPLNVRLCFTATTATAAACAAENGTTTETNLDRVGNCEIADLGQGNDLVLAPTLLTGAAVPDLTYYGNDGDDFMTGGDGDDLIYGGAGSNVLDGAGNTGDVCVTHLGATDVRRRCELGDKSTVPVCVPGALQCAASGAARVQTCESDGNWSYGSFCTGSTPSCSAGACVP